MQKEQLFRTLVDECGGKIFRICCWYFNDPDERDDAYQEALIRVWEHADTFKGGSEISTWIYRVKVNACLSGIRSDKRRRRHLVEDGGSLDDLEIMEFHEENDPEHEQKLLFFRDFMSVLDTADRTLVSLYLEELSTREMAEITGLSESNVRVRIFRIREIFTPLWIPYPESFSMLPGLKFLLEDILCLNLAFDSGFEFIELEIN